MERISGLMAFIYFQMVFAPFAALCQQPAASKAAATTTGFKFINISFENASPLDWDIDSNGVVQVALTYDHERSSPNRANGHWHYLVEALPGTDLTVEMRNFENIYNGRKASPVSSKTKCLVSENDRDWKVVPAELTNEGHLKVNLHFTSGALYLASVEPYRLSDLETLKKSIASNRLVNISEIGKTAEGRPLEMIRVGNPNAPHHVVLRVRAHSWEPGGNWVADGLIKSLLQPDGAAFLKEYCVYIMPMANKDGVAHGRTRFNSNGVDLNRQWDLPADTVLAPEKYAFEKWLKKMIASGKKPDLAMDLHNDEGGKLHLNAATNENAAYIGNFKRLENLLYKYTWFREGTQQSVDKGSFGEGLAARFGVDACVLEFNYEWSTGLGKMPMGKDWQLFGRELRNVFSDYFQGK